MPRRLLAAACLAAALLITGSSARGQNASAPAGPTPREPLAMTVGAADRPATVRSAEARARALAAPEVLFRLPPDEVIRSLIDSTSVTNMTAIVQRLEDFVTRYVVTDSCWAAGYWIRDRFFEYGYADTRLDTFRQWTWQDSVDAVNVLAYKEGAARPREYVVLGGHYDSVTTDNFSDPDAPAPGAEDNASGVAGVLEAARILADVDTERSIIFACWSGEEEGLWGSRHFVRNAVAESLDIVLYLNMDCIGYDAPPLPDAIVFADSSALAVAAWMCDIARDHTGYEFEPAVQPLGASDQNSFWEAGYNVLDTATDLSSPYMHTSEDLLVNMDPVYATALAAVNVAATAAVAGIVSEDANLPPETTLVRNCAATHDSVTARPTFEWRAVDFDGEVAYYVLSVEERSERRRSAGPPDDPWAQRPTRLEQRVSAGETSVTLGPLHPGDYEFRVWATDDDGLSDASPASHAFTVSDSFAPVLTVETNFLPEPLDFLGNRAPRDDPRSAVFEDELLVFAIAADASHYCGVADSVVVAVGDTAAWSFPRELPCELMVRPSLEDTVVAFRTRDENGSATTGRIFLQPVPTPMDLPLLHVDDWLDSAAPEDLHDAFYDLLLSGQPSAEWDPYQHFQGGFPTLPPMEELGRYRTVFWTLDSHGGLLRPAQAETMYHPIEGYVRAGGNLILEGQSALTSLGGGHPMDYQMTFESGDFTFDHVGVDSLLNAGNWSDPGLPDGYGYAFLGGIAVAPLATVHLPVDTLGKWAQGYQLHGGVPFCEIVRPTDETARLFLFDSYLNPTLDERPCATIRFPHDATGTVAYFGFPFYYLQSAPAITAVGDLILCIDDWQAPSDLIFFDRVATRDSVALSWYLAPPDRPLGCDIERAVGISDSTGVFVRLNEVPIAPGAGNRYRFTDSTVLPGATYWYRLLVVEQWGGVSTHGPWQVVVPPLPPFDRLLPPRPNPCLGTVEIHYAVGADRRWVSVDVYDLAGRHVKNVCEGPASAGDYTDTWDGTNASGRGVAAGVYFVRARIGPSRLERKIVLLR